MVKSLDMDSLHVYEVKFRYAPTEHNDDSDSYMLIEQGDILEVPHQNLHGEQPDHLQAWINGYNVTRNVNGLFPGPYVRYLGIKGADGMVEDPPMILPPIPPKPRSTSSQPQPHERPDYGEDTGKGIMAVLKQNQVIA